MNEDLIQTCKRLYANGWLAACDGNVSVRLDDEVILITPSQRHKGFLNENELARVNLDGEVLEGSPSSELAMHLEVYRRCEKAKAVIHAHPPVATAWSIARPDLTALPADCCSEVILSLGHVPIISYARPGTEAMAERLRPHLPHAKVMILAHHGSLSWGTSLEEAFNGTERLEHVATTLMHAHQIGGLNPLPHHEVSHLKQLRQKMGDRTL